MLDRGGFLLPAIRNEFGTSTPASGRRAKRLGRLTDLLQVRQIRQNPKTGHENQNEYQAENPGGDIRFKARLITEKPMKPTNFQTKLDGLAKTLKFYLVKIPFTYIAVTIGFLFEFIITFPYIVMTEIDGRRRKR